VGPGRGPDGQAGVGEVLLLPAQHLGRVDAQANSRGRAHQGELHRQRRLAGFRDSGSGQPVHLLEQEPRGLLQGRRRHKAAGVHIQRQDRARRQKGGSEPDDSDQLPRREAGGACRRLHDAEVHRGGARRGVLPARPQPQRRGPGLGQRRRASGRDHRGGLREDDKGDGEFHRLQQQERADRGIRA